MSYSGERNYFGQAPSGVDPSGFSGCTLLGQGYAGYQPTTPWEQSGYIDYGSESGYTGIQVDSEYRSTGYSGYSGYSGYAFDVMGTIVAAKNETKQNAENTTGISHVEPQTGTEDDMNNVFEDYHLDILDKDHQELAQKLMQYEAENVAGNNMTGMFLKLLEPVDYALSILQQTTTIRAAEDLIAGNLVSIQRGILYRETVTITRTQYMQDDIIVIPSESSSKLCKIISVSIPEYIEGTDYHIVRQRGGILDLDGYIINNITTSEYFDDTVSELSNFAQDMRYILWNYNYGSVPADLSTYDIDIVYLAYDDTNSIGHKVVFKADAYKGLRANAFVRNNHSADDLANIYFTGTNFSLSDLEIGTNYFLGKQGQITKNAPGDGSGELYQLVGSACNSSALQFKDNDPMLRSILSNPIELADGTTVENGWPSWLAAGIVNWLKTIAIVLEWTRVGDNIEIKLALYDWFYWEGDGGLITEPFNDYFYIHNYGSFYIIDYASVYILDDYYLTLTAITPYRKELDILSYLDEVVLDAILITTGGEPE